MKQWLDPRQPDKVIVKKNRFGPEVMLCVWWNFKAWINWEFLPNGHVVDGNFYSRQLEQVHEILRRRYPVLFNQDRVLLQQGNARPHAARTTMAKIQELGTTELLPHPAYSPDLAL